MSFFCGIIKIVKKRVLFKIDENLDFENHLIGLNIFLKNSIKVPPDVIQYYEELKNINKNEQREVFIKKTRYFYNENALEIRSLLVKQTQEMWDLIDEKYFNKMEEIHKNVFPLETISAILSTTSTVYGYNFNNKNPWFACPYDSSIKAIHTAMHEIMHVFFNEYFYKEYKLKFDLNDEQIYLIKESLTVILNLEFENIRIYPDKSKPGHEEIREKIKNNWIKHRDIAKVLEEICIYVKTKV